MKRQLLDWFAVLASKRLIPLLAATSSAPLILTLAGCSGGVLDPQGPIGAANAKILLNALGVMLLIVVPTIAAALVFAWWFRASNTRARYQPGFVYSGRIELVVWAIPILTIVFLGGMIWIGAHDLDPYKPIAGQKDPLKIQVVSLDWKWLFIYPDHGIASVNELTVPVGVPVHFSLTSAAVMNMFFVPRLGTMIATMPGMVTQLHLKADHTGDLHGLSTQFSGDGFSGMNFTLRAVPEDAFARWVAQAQETGPWLDRAGYIELLRESQNVRPFTYQSVEPGLFEDIVTGRLPFGEGPGSEGSGPPVRPRGAT
jgi:cytochrome o ubiquinol oxidase subunit II